MSDLGFPDSEETGPERSGAGRLFVGLLILAVAITALVSVIAYGISNLETTGACDGPVGECTGLSIERIEKIGVIDLPEGSEVLSSVLERTTDSSLLRASIRLPEGAANPFDASVYSGDPRVAPDWAEGLDERYQRLAFYRAATVGERDEIAGALAEDANGRLTLFLYSLITL